MLKLHYQNFEQTLLILLKEAKRGPISIDRFLTILSGRGKILLLAFLSLGFTGVPAIGGFIGFFICYLGIRIAMKKRSIWLPNFLRRRKLIPSFLIRTIEQILKVLKFIKHWSHPRYEWATQKSSTRIINGLVISVVGLCLAVCPPIPMTGWIACLAILFISIGLLNDDGIYIILGYIAALFYLITTLLLLNYCSLTQICEWVKVIGEKTKK